MRSLLLVYPFRTLLLVFFVRVGVSNVHAAPTPALTEVAEALRQARFVAAEQLLETAYAEREPDGVYFSIKGLVASKQQRFGEAENFLKKAAIAGMGKHAAAFNLAEFYYQLGEYEKALVQYKLIEDGAGVSELARFKRMMCYLLTGNLDAAKLVLARMNMKDPLPVYHCAHAAWAFTTGEVEVGRYYVQAAQALYRDRSEAFLPLLREQGWIE